MSEELDQERV